STFLLTLGFNYIGAQADINVWNPKVAQTNEFTRAEIWLKNNNGSYFSSVEKGWTEPNSGNWYLKVKNNMAVGYWPTEIVELLRHSVNSCAIQFLFAGDELTRDLEGFLDSKDGGFTLAMEVDVVEGGCIWGFHG
ncbi:hypothetical protein V8G54_007892, partial [Vigna mungo]